MAAGGLQEADGNAEQQQRALQEDDIDNILARAEVVKDTSAEQGPAGGDLLSSFNVATFQVRSNQFLCPLPLGTPSLPANL